MIQEYAHPAQQYLQLKEKNLYFFQRYYPGIFQFISQYQMKRCKLDILTETNEIDILDSEKHLYGGSSSSYCKREVANFLSVFDYGSKIHSIRPLEKNAYQNQRFAAQAINKLQNKYHENADEFAGYQLDELLPLVVFMGIGLGKHIDILTQVRSISHVVALETNMDHFAASLYAVDWEQIILPFLEDENRSFEFVLLPEPPSEAHIYAHLWNCVIKFCPLFPITTLFYNHQGNTLYDRISDKINADLYVHLFSFGNVDDELNQLNNALHNFKKNIPPLNAEQVLNSNVPICIVGSGPSLDSRIDDLKFLADKAIIISSGTALRALWKHGVVPDFQVELESDLNSALIQSQMEDRAFMQSIKIIGAAQLNPHMFDLFGESRLFFKQDGALGDWFGGEASIIENATPTCTNAALAIALRLKNKSVFLFGLDYGFPEKGAHHASGSLYFKEGIKEKYQLNDKDLIEVPAAKGGKILTTTFLYTAKRRTENILSHAGKNTLFNCSEGAQIDHTQWLNSEQVKQLDFHTSETDKFSFIKTLFNQDDTPLSPESIQSSLDSIEKEVQALVLSVTRKLNSQAITTKIEFTQLVSWFIPLLRELEQTDRGLFYFLRGSIWHFLLAGYTHVYSLKGNVIEEYLSFWRETFIEMLAMFEHRFKAVIYNTLEADQDPMINHRLCEAIMDELTWEYQGYSIIDNKIIKDEKLQEA